MTVGKEVWPNGVPEVGQIAKRSRQVTSRDIELFTEISGDRNPSQNWKHASLLLMEPSYWKDPQFVIQCQFITDQLTPQWMISTR